MTRAKWWAAAAALVLSAATADARQAEAARSPLVLKLAVDRTKATLGEEVQFEVTLENPSGEEQEITELTFETRSVSLSVQAKMGEQTRDYVLAVVRPDPHIMVQLPLARVKLGARKSVNLLHRVPCIATGSFTFTAKYAGVEPELASSPVTVDVEPSPEGSKLGVTVELENLGAFTIRLRAEASPANVTNFVTLVRRGFYDNLRVFRVIKGSWIQAGCPENTGFGWPGYCVRAELGDPSALHVRGAVSMCSYGKTSYTGSQFFICLSDLPSLNNKFTIIGSVESDDMEKVVAPLASKDVDRETDTPKVPIVMKRVTTRILK